MMAKPIKPKSLKPKSSGNAPEGGIGDAPAKVAPSKTAVGDVKKGPNMLQTIILGVVIIIASIVGPALTLYLLGPTMIAPMIQQAMPAAAEGEEGEGEHGEAAHGDGHGAVAHAPSLGLNLAMEDFTTNLHQPAGAKGNQFLRAKMSLAIAVPQAEDCNLLGGHDEHADAGGGGGHGAPAVVVDPVEECYDKFNKKMAAYTPTLRDIINTALMKRTANELSTLEGQEEIKDELKHEMNAVVGNHGYTVQRVNLQDFIIQR
jgi:flagellar basal body-associated protein FliL